MRRYNIGGPLGAAALTTLVLWSALSVASAADDLPIRFQARVIWIAAQTLLVATEDSQSISIDLTHVAQDQYQRLVLNDQVVVTGTIPAERNRVVATSIEPLDP
jgi:type 1 fimbria pilin